MQSIEQRLRSYEPFFGKWVLGDEMELLGKGQSSYVYTIRKGPQTAALKLISIPMDEAALDRLMHSLGSEEKVKARLLRDFKYAENEIRMMDKLNGTSNIVYFENSAIFERADTYGWDVLIRMEKLIPFEKYLKQIGSKRTTELVLRIWDELLEGLKACQSLGIVHLDIKPQNIFYNPDTNYFKLGDFSEAKRSQKGELVAVNAKFGTRGYIPPEIEKKRGGDTRADLYSLALVIYSLLNHDCLPFVQKGAVTLNEEIDRADQRRFDGEQIPRIKGLHPRVMDILARCLEYDPEKRYPTAREVQDDLRRFIYEPPGFPWKRILIAAASLAAVGALAFVGVNALRGRNVDSAGTTPVQTAQSTQNTQTTAPVRSGITAQADFDLVDGAARGGQKYVYSGQAEPNAQVRILLNGAEIGSVKAGRDGAWKAMLEESRIKGAKNCTVGFAYENEAGILLDPFVYDDSVSQPAITEKVYVDAYQVVGRADPDAEVTLYTHRRQRTLGTARASATGAFAITLGERTLADLGVSAGDELVLMARDAVGNESLRDGIKVLEPEAQQDVPFALDYDVVPADNPVITGTAPGGIVWAYADNRQVGNAQVKNGRFSLKLEGDFISGDHVLQCMTEEGMKSLPFEVVGEAAAQRNQDAPFELTEAGVDGGKLILKGTAPNGSLELYADGSLVNTQPVDGGTFTLESAYDAQKRYILHSVKSDGSRAVAVVEAQ